MFQVLLLCLMTGGELFKLMHMYVHVDFIHLISHPNAFYRLSPDRMEERDGFLTMTRHKIEAAVKTNGLPGIMIAHSVRNTVHFSIILLLPTLKCSNRIILISFIPKMGNSVFRYFQEWLRVQLREEAYSRYVHEAEQAAAVRAAMAAGNTDGVPPRGPFWRGRAWVRHHLPGRVSDDEIEHAFSNYLEEYDDDELLNQEDLNRGETSTNSQNINDNQPEDSKRKYPKLWELAKVDGDRDFIDWLGKHIWTYVGLAAPLLGAPGPLRSVISGENMGLPFTDEEARTLELCKYSICSLSMNLHCKPNLCVCFIMQ